MYLDRAWGQKMKIKAKAVLTIAAVLAVVTFGNLEAFAQDAVPAPQSQVTAPFTAQQLDQMLAPIALYPDSLVAQILMAATYPLEVVEADRWLRDPNHAALKGEPLAAALDQQQWDPSVKSLVPFPQILRMMDGNLDWTEQMGDAFLANQAASMDSIQRLRQWAEAAGKLSSTVQEVVATAGPAITIEPASPDIVYVPVYDPAVIYGVWPYPAFPPYYFPNYFGSVVLDSFGFGWMGVAIIGPLWGWNHFDWGRHRIDLDRDRFAGLDRTRDHDQPQIGSTWTHNPSHRLGVPYRDPVMLGRFAGRTGALDAHRNFRGYPTESASQLDATPGVRRASDFGRSQEPLTGMPPASPHFPPTFESFGRGAVVRAEAGRGRDSRMSSPGIGPSRMAAPRPMSSGGWRRR